MNLFASAEDIIRLTGKKRFSAQRRILDAMKIPYKPSATGEPLVLESSLDGKVVMARNRGPRWDQINV